MKIEVGDRARWESKDGKEIVQGVVAYVEEYEGEELYNIYLVFATEYVEGNAWVPLAECALVEKGGGGSGQCHKS